MKRHYIIQVGMILLLLALGVACAHMPLAQPAAEGPAEVEVAAPPEEAVPVDVESEIMSDSEFYAANPELMVANRYPAAMPQGPLTDSAFYAANPELMTVRRYAEAREAKPVSDSTFYATNPELMVANRYPAAMPQGPLTDSAFYAANPELCVAHRYAAAVIHHRILFPGR